MGIDSYTGSSMMTFYVDGENGDNNNDDLEAQTLSTAWQTIEHAFDRIQSADAGSPADGDEIRIVKTSDDRTYYSETTKASLDWSNREVLIVGANSAGVVDGTRPVIYGTDLASDNCIWEITTATTDQTTVANLEFNGGDAAGCLYCISFSASNSHNMSWINCRFHSASSHGFDCSLANYNKFINCQFDNNGGDGLYHNVNHYGLVYKCLFNDNVSDGACFLNNTRIIQSVFYNNGALGCSIGAQGSVICGCVFADNTSDGLYVSTGVGTIAITDSISSGNGAYGWNIYSSAEVHFFNCHSGGNTSGEKTIGSTDHVIMHMRDATSDPSWESESTYDFTPAGDEDVISAGVATPFLYMGDTTSDVGLNKFRVSPYQLRAGIPRRYI